MICLVNAEGKKGFHVPRSSTQLLSSVVQELSSEQNLTLDNPTLFLAWDQRYQNRFNNVGNVSFLNEGNYKKYSKKYLTAEKEARKDELGLWKGTFEMPWDWRKNDKK